MAGWKPLNKMRLLSKYTPRVEAPLKVTGRARYTYDQLPAGLLYGAVLTSPLPAARIVQIDASRALAHPACKAVLTDVHPTGTIRYAGEEVAAVAVSDPEAIEEVLGFIQVQYEKRAFVADIEAAMQEGAPRVFENRPNVREPNIRGEGDVDAGFARADVVLEREFRTQVQVHACLEPHGSVAMWEGDELILWDSTQAVHGVREAVARHLELPLNKVRVICQHMGGGFGSKLQAGTYAIIAARLARQTGAPVRLMLTRKQDSLSAGNRPNSIQYLKMGARRDGRIVAFSATTYGTAGIGTNAGVRTPIVYDIPNWRHVHHDVFTNAGPARAFRAPGCPQASFAMEQLMDEMAEALQMDPLVFRLKNDSNSTRHKEWRLGAERFGWQKKYRPARENRRQPGPRKRGVGMGASIWWPGGRGTKATLLVYPDGAVEVKCGTQDIGTGTRTYVAAVAAEELGLPMKQVKPLIGDSDYPWSGASGGSTTSPSVAPAIKNTAEKARLELARLAAQYWNVSPETVHWGAGEVYLADRPSRRMDWKTLCSLLDDAPLEVHGEWVEGLSSAGVAGCQFVEVVVDTETGLIQVEKVLAVADCGLILNRLTTESQVNGAIIQGISYALLEERWMDPLTGTMVNPDFENYKILGTMETPEIEVILFDQPERGVIGIGEPPTIPTSGAIANAVYNATGVRLRQLPMTPDRVLAALAREKEGGGQ